MKNHSKLLMLLLTLAMVSSCGSNNKSSTDESSNNSSTITESTNNDSSTNQNSQATSVEESSNKESSLPSESLEESSSSFEESSTVSEESSLDVEESSSMGPVIETKTLTINSENFDKLDGITLYNVTENTQYKTEFTVNTEGYISSEAISGITKIVAHIYSTYDNMKMYAGTSSSGTQIKGVQEVAADGKSAYYTYDFATPSDSFYYLNGAATNRVHLYSIEITYTGECNVTLKTDEPVDPNEGNLETDKNGWTNTDIKDYYSSLDLSLSGNDLLASLRTINSAKKTKNLTYNDLWNYFNKTDYDPKDSSKYIAFYVGSSASRSEMNKEHVWPKSRGGNLVDGDLHMTRPTLTKDNSSRGNSFYVEGRNSSSAGWDPKTAGLNEIYRGQAARIIFYCVVANNQLSLVDKDNDDTSNKTMGKLSDLLKWNLQYPVQDSELRRNNGAQSVQGNRNPFIDNPSFACSIFGSTNSTTREICATQKPITPTTPEPSNPTVDPEDPNENSSTPSVEPSNEKTIVLTTTSLNLAAYADASAVVNSTTFAYSTVGTYGTGIQMKKQVSYLYNKDAFASSIEKIEFNYASAKDIYGGSFTCKFGNDINVSSYLQEITLDASNKTYTVVPDSAYTYFKLLNDGPNALYWDSIIIYLA